MLAGILFIVSMHLYIQKISIKNEIKRYSEKLLTDVHSFWCLWSIA